MSDLQADLEAIAREADALGGAPGQAAPAPDPAAPPNDRSAPGAAAPGAAAGAETLTAEQQLRRELAARHFDGAPYQTLANDTLDMGLSFVTAETGVAFSDKRKAEGAQRLAVLIAKYEGKWPIWFLRWKEEFAMAAWIGGAAWGAYKLVRAERAKAPAPAGPAAAPGAPAPSATLPASPPLK